MSDKLELAELAKKLEPFILTTLERAGVSPTGVYAPSPHALNSLHHFGEITQSQASWAVPNTTQVIAGDGLTGGGALNTDVTLNVNVGTGLVITGDQLVLDWTATVPTTITPGDASATGSSSYAARSDHQHGHYSFGTPGTILPDAVAAEGSADNYARSDHTHAITAASPSTNLAYNTGNSEGSANWFARSDHLHNITTSDNPGASASILNTDTSGYFQVLGIGIGTSVSADNRIELASGSEIGQPTGPELQFDSNNQQLILLFNNSQKIKFFDEGGMSISPTHGSTWTDKPNIWYYVYGDATSIADPLNGYESHIYHNAATTQGHIRGYYALVRSGSNTSAVVTNLYGAYYQLQGYGGDITQATGLSIWVDSWNADTTIGTARGVHVDINQSSGTVTTSYGILIEDLVGVTKYAIHTGVGTISLGDDIQFRQASAITTTSGDLTFYATGGDLLISASNTLSVDNWASGTTGWGVSYAGVADFRSINTDELVTKAFVSDTTFTLAGSILLTKSRAILSRDFTIPAISSSGTIYLEDLEGLPDTAVFVSGDTIRLRYIDRSGGGLVISDVWGTVTTYTDLSGGEQSWSFTTAADAGGAAGSDVFAGSIALDYGQTGSGSRGVIHMTVTDAAGSPYLDIQDWNTLTSGAPSDLTTHVRLGNLDGISGIGAEYGLWAGLTSYQYFLASDSSFEAHGLALSLYESINVTIYIDPANPSIRIGDNATSMSYTSQTGIWMGNDSSTYKMRIGDPTGVRVQWVGNALEFYNASNIKTIDFIASGQAQISGQLTMPGTSSAISIGVTPPTSASVGTGIWIDRTGMYGLDASTQEIIFDATNGRISAGAGNISLGSEGMVMAGTGVAIFDDLETDSTISWNSSTYIKTHGVLFSEVLTSPDNWHRMYLQIESNDKDNASYVNRNSLEFEARLTDAAFSDVVYSSLNLINVGSAELATFALTASGPLHDSIISVNSGGNFYFWHDSGSTAATFDMPGSIYLSTNSTPSIYFGASDDVRLYRYAADYLATPDNMLIESTLYLGATDTNLYRSSANILRTNDSLVVDVGLFVGAAVSPTADDIGYDGNLWSRKGGTRYDVYAFYPLVNYIASATYAGGAFSTFAKTAKTVSTEFSGVPSTAQALLLNVSVRDSASAANECWCIVAGNNAAGDGLTARCSGLANDKFHTQVMVAPTNGSGTIYFQGQASGASTLDISIRCYGYWV